MSGSKTKIIKLLIDEISFDPMNANKMADEDYAQLVTNIKAIGDMLQPVLVKETDEGYEMVDGEHRAKAARDAGMDSVLAVVWDGSEAMRKAMALGFNKLRGEHDLTRVQSIMLELQQADWSIDQMLMTGYRENDINDLLAIKTDATADEVMEHPVEAVDNDTPANPRPLVLEITFATSAQLKIAKKGLKKAAGKGRELGDGLLSLLGHDS